LSAQYNRAGSGSFSSPCLWLLGQDPKCNIGPPRFARRPMNLICT
jgi:hypothetical protein